MTIRHHTFATNEVLTAANLNDVTNNGVVEISSSSDLSNSDLANVNLVYDVAEAGIRVRISAGDGASHWSDPFDSGGFGAANFTDTATGTYSDAGITYKYKTYTASGTLTIDADGLIDVYCLGGGGGADSYAYCSAQNVDAVCGGDGGSVADGTFFLPSGTYTVTVGAGGSGRYAGSASSIGSAIVGIGGNGGKSRGNTGGRGASGITTSGKSGTAGRTTTLRNTTETHGGGGGAGSGYNPYVGPGSGVDGGASGRAGTGGGGAISATANRGGGAGGAAWRFCDQGTGTGNGGSGIVIVRVAT